MEKHEVWIEKYRPKTFAEIKGQDEIIKRIEAFVKTKNIPHMLFAGPAGTGKTTTALVIARTLFKDKWRENFLELNASDERGIDVIRGQVKDFARTKAIGDVPFKIIYLDEADALTREAQQALRRTMENYTRTCRFILAANYASKIIDPIQSRCAVFKFRPLAEKDIKAIVKRIAKEENLQIDDEAIEALYEISEGDCRKAENILQSCAILDKKITAKAIYRLASYASPKEILQIMELAIKGEFEKARDALLKLMLDYGMSGLDTIKLIQRRVWDLDIDNKKKVELIDKCGEIEFRLVEGSDEFLQLESLLAYLTTVKE